ncbi:MAG: sugar phosphate isomerase/epimerase, partial [Phycisphaerales bacterium]|nr:sugar phosphate isomerase/epimerase [Phycisphaerales bacterium]
RGVHAHLPIGEGDMDFPPIFRALRDVGYPGPVNVELSRHSHDAVNMARRTLEALRPMMG